MRSPKHSSLNAIASSFLTWIGKGLALSALHLRVARERRALSQLTDAQLRDIGVSREDAMRESNRMFEIPANRLSRKSTMHDRWSSAVGALTEECKPTRIR